VINTHFEYGDKNEHLTDMKNDFEVMASQQLAPYFSSVISYSLQQEKYISSKGQEKAFGNLIENVARSGCCCLRNPAWEAVCMYVYWYLIANHSDCSA
jgi:hypothetical protein